MWGTAAPIFRVANLANSVDYYVNVLGFKIDWSAATIASVSRDRCCIFLCEGDQGNPGAWTWIGVPDVTTLCDDLRAKGAKIRNPPTNYDWALEMQLEDLDGNVLRIGSDPLEDRPKNGPWRDMHGHVWAEKPDGGWERIE